MAVAMHAAAVHFAATDTTGEAAGINNASLDFSGDLLDETDFKDTSGWRKRIQGLKSLAFTASGHYIYNDSPQALLISSFLTGATVYVRVLFDGTNGFKCAMKIESLSINGDLDNTAQVSVTLQSVAAPAAVP